MEHLNTMERCDLQEILADNVIPWHLLKGKTVLVTGATGLVGRALTQALLYAGETVCGEIRVIAPVRDVKKATDLFDSQAQERGTLVLLPWEAERALETDGPVDYAVHCASQTASRAFVRTPVETIRTAVFGTEHVLRLAHAKGAKTVYLSSLEACGDHQTDEKVPEDYSGPIDPLAARSCYPESKRLCENLCAAYFHEYGLPVNILRLAQTFGPGVRSSDQRVFAEFARCVCQGRDIVLRTAGDMRHSYVASADAVRAILLVLLAGEAGAAYNVANEATYCSILDMAELAAHTIADGRIAVKLDQSVPLEQLGYPKPSRLNLDASRLRQLGWTPRQTLRDMLERLVFSFREQENGLHVSQQTTGNRIC